MEIGIAVLETITGKVKVVYDQVLSHPPEKIEPHRNAWIFKNSSLSYEEVVNGKPVTEAANEIRTILQGRKMAIYNVAFDFERFLKWPPYNLGEVIAGILPCIMVTATNVCKIRSRFYGYKWPTLEEARRKLLPDIQLPKNFNPHRAASDAYLSALVLHQLIQLGQYNINDRYLLQQPERIERNSSPYQNTAKVSFDDFLKGKRID